MSTDPLADLGPDDRSTALDLLAAFDAVHVDRPSPATTAEEDADTAARLASAFHEVTHTQQPPPAGGGDAAPALVPVPMPARRARRRGPAAWLAAAAAAVLLASAVVLWPSGSSTAWAAEPRPTTASDRAAIEAACAAPLSRGLGELESSGGVTVGGDDVVTAPDPASPPAQLPPLSVLDVRGDVAFAVFQDAAWTVTCVLLADGDAWADQGLQVGPGSSGATPGIVAGGGTQLLDGEQITTVSGSAPAGTARATFALDDGTLVDASILGSTWAAWFPGDRRLDPATITFYDATGRALAL